MASRQFGKLSGSTSSAKKKKQPQKQTVTKRAAKATVPVPTPGWSVRLSQIAKGGLAYLKANWIGTVLILLMTLAFFWPYITRISSYSEGGDAMFNAWTLSRDHACIMRENCANYANGNIFFPHADTMLYSETQLSAGLITLPLAWINDNPIFAYNIWTIASYFFAGWFMYLLAKYLSKNNELVSVIAGAAFEFAPFKMTSYSHLQNLSIFYLPLIVLLLFKYLDLKRRKYLVFLFIALVLLFYASWYQMVFSLIALGILIGGLLIFKLANRRAVIALCIVIALAAATTYPLAKQYVAWAKTTDSAFSVGSQVTYESSLADYFLPNKGTLLGQIYYNLRPNSQLNSYNPDSVSYQGMIMYTTALLLLISSFLWWRRHKDGKDLKLITIFVVIGLTGFVMSLGPLLKFKSHYIYAHTSGGIGLVMPLPWLLVDKFLPQLRFIRAIGRASVLVLFALCCTICFLPLQIEKYRLKKRATYAIYGIFVFFCIFELFPIHRVPMSPAMVSSYNITIPPVYKFIKNHKEVDDIIILRSDYNYPDAVLPTALTEEVMWAGYDNKYTFNGYSGYLPPDYYPELYNFDSFRPAVVPEMKQLGLRYVLVDKLLSTKNPQLRDQVAAVLGNPVYEDGRYALFKIQ